MHFYLVKNKRQALIEHGVKQRRNRLCAIIQKIEGLLRVHFFPAGLLVDQDVADPASR